MHISKRIFDWSPAELRYARQLGVRHIIGLLGAERAKPAWDFLDLLQLRKQVETYGLELSAIEAPPEAIMRVIDEYTHRLVPRARPGSKENDDGEPA